MSIATSGGTTAEERALAFPCDQHLECSDAAYYRHNQRKSTSAAASTVTPVESAEAQARDKMNVEGWQSG